MTVEQLICDLDELVDGVCQRLGKTRVAIFGRSWGSALGVLYAARFPEKVAAYVGCGQIDDWPAAEAASYEFALEPGASATAGQCGSCWRSARRRTRPGLCSRNAPGCHASKARCALGPCGR